MTLGSAQDTFHRLLTKAYFKGTEGIVGVLLMRECHTYKHPGALTEFVVVVMQIWWFSVTGSILPVQPQAVSIGGTN
jgi:hypothetical protein